MCLEQGCLFDVADGGWAGFCRVLVGSAATHMTLARRPRCSEGRYMGCCLVSRFTFGAKYPEVIKVYLRGRHRQRGLGGKVSGALVWC